MAATTTATPKATAYPRAQPVKRSKAPATMPIATSSAPPLSSAARGKRPRASEGAGETDKDRPRRVKSSRGQKRADVTGAVVDDAEPKAENGSTVTATAQGTEGGGAYRRVMFTSFIKQAFEKRAKVSSPSYCMSFRELADLSPLHRATMRSTTRLSCSFALSYRRRRPLPRRRRAPGNRLRHRSANSDPGSRL